MGDLPTTTVKDLQAMGITPRMVKEAIEKAGKVIHGKVLHFYLPKDNYKHDPNIHRARNYLKSDWELVETRPTVTVKEECSEESFRNFDSEKQSQIHFERSVTITTINEFALTKNFDVSVNANIPLGMGGTLRGFTAVESANEVKSRSTSTDETHKVSIDIDVPAGEGRNVSIRTTQRSTEYVYRALLGVKGTVGIEVDPAWYQRNQYWWIYPAECAFPNASVSREIVKTYIETNVETLIREIYRDKVGDILECRSVVFPRPTSDEGLLTETRADNLAYNIGCDTAPNFQLGSPGPSTFTSELMVQLDFGGTDLIDRGDRLSKVTALNMMVQARIQPIGCVGSIGGVIWLPNTEEMTLATFRIPFDPVRITRDGLIEQFLQLKGTIDWEGSHCIRFT